MLVDEGEGDVRLCGDFAVDGDPARGAAEAHAHRRELGVNEQGQRCYDFLAKNIQLGTPLAKESRPETFGENLLLVYMAQAPFDDPNDFGSFKVACIKSRYIAPDFKDPPQGQIVLIPEDFRSPGDLDLSLDCIGLTPPPVP